HFGERAILVGHVAQAEGDGDPVEIAVRERQRLRVALDGRLDVARVEHAVTADRQHRGIDVGEPDLASRTDAAGKGLGEIGGAAGHVEHLHARAHAGLADGEGLPGAVQADRHQVVHQVVALRDRMEDAGHLARLLLGGYPPVAEIGGLVPAHRWGLETERARRGAAPGRATAGPGPPASPGAASRLRPAASSRARYSDQSRSWLVARL